jgi:homoserine kinase type II
MCTPAAEIDVSECMRFLARYGDDDQPTSPLETLGNAGGLSGSLLWRFESRRGTLVLRAHPADRPNWPPLEQIHEWISHARTLGFVPVPIPDRQGRTSGPLSTRLAQIEPWMPGAAVLDGTPNRLQVQAAFRALGGFHQALARTRRLTVPPGLTRRCVELRDLRDGSIHHTYKRLLTFEPSPEQALALEWARRVDPLLPRIVHEVEHALQRDAPVQVCLRDCRGQHFLFTGQEVTGLVDMGAMDFDSPAADLSRLLLDWDSRDPSLRPAALDAYASVHTLDLATSSLIRLYESTAATLAPAHWIRWHFLEARRFDDPHAPLEGLERALVRFRRLHTA